MRCSTAPVSWAKLDFVSPRWLVLPSWDKKMWWDNQAKWIAIVGVVQRNLSRAVQWV